MITWPRHGFVIAALVALLIVYLVVLPTLFAQRSYVLTMIITASLLAVMALGVWLTFAIGRINIAQGGFALVGAYTAAILISDLGWSFWLALPMSGLASFALGLLIGLPILRLKGVYFAMLTLCLAEALRLGALNATAVTNGASGMVGLPLPGALNLFGLTLIEPFEAGDRLPFYFLSALLLIAATALVWRIHRSPLGALFRSLQQNEELASSLGVDVARYRLIAFAIACGLGGLGGAVFAVLQQNVYPSSYQITDSVYLMMYCFVGGLAHPLGAVLGTFVLVLGFEALAGLQPYQSLLFAALMITAMVSLPNGLVSLFMIDRTRRSSAILGEDRVDKQVAPS